MLRDRHPDTLSSMDSVACDLQDAGRHAEAAKLHRRVLEARQEVLGHKHPDTLSSMHNLAFAVEKTGQHAEAAELRRRVLEAGRGDEHSGTKPAATPWEGLLRFISQQDRVCWLVALCALTGCAALVYKGHRG